MKGKEGLVSWMMYREWYVYHWWWCLWVSLMIMIMSVMVVSVIDHDHVYEYDHVYVYEYVCMYDCTVYAWVCTCMMYDGYLYDVWWILVWLVLIDTDWYSPLFYSLSTLLTHYIPLEDDVRLSLCPFRCLRRRPTCQDPPQQAQHRHGPVLKPSTGITRYDII